MLLAVGWQIADAHAGGFSDHARQRLEQTVIGMGFSQRTEQYHALPVRLFQRLGDGFMRSGRFARADQVGQHARTARVECLGDGGEVGKPSAPVR
jgi:hypothetical protein